jgi:arylformamidase
MSTPKYYDITLPLSERVTKYGGDNYPVFSTANRSTDYYTITSTTITFSVHTGTHVDAPKHLYPDGYGINEVPLDHLIGTCAVIQIPDDAAVITLEHIRPLAELVKKHQRVLFKTRDSARWADTEHEFVPEYVYMAPDAAAWLASLDVKLVGMDYLSVDPYKDDEMPAHLALLKAGVAIVEGCKLLDVPPGEYELICLPLRLAGLDGSPARAVLRELY